MTKGAEYTPAMGKGVASLGQASLHGVKHHNSIVSLCIAILQRRRILRNNLGHRRP